MYSGDVFKGLAAWEEHPPRMEKTSHLSVFGERSRACLHLYEGRIYLGLSVNGVAYFRL